MTWENSSHFCLIHIKWNCYIVYSHFWLIYIKWNCETQHNIHAKYILLLLWRYIFLHKRYLQQKVHKWQSNLRWSWNISQNCRKRTGKKEIGNGHVTIAVKLSSYYSRVKAHLMQIGGQGIKTCSTVKSNHLNDK